MHVDLYERIWMWAAAVIVASFMAAMMIPAVVAAVHPPSHVETIDPTNLANHPEFGTGGVTARPDGSVVVSVVTTMYFFTPDPLTVPAGKPVTFRITSGDVVHGFEVVGTNANAMAIPGYVSQFTVTFPKPGEYVIACHEYCGIMHHQMVGKLIVQ